MADYSWIIERGAGALAHISSLPSSQGIGAFGKGAELFLNFLQKSGFKYWQICPLGPTGFGDSPYQSFSAFAGNTYFIDYDELVQAGLLNADSVNLMRSLPNDKCDFGRIYEVLPTLLKKAASNPDIEQKLSYEISFKDFCAQNAGWLDDYAAFAALKEKFHGKVWNQWPSEFKFRKFAKLDEGLQSSCREVKIGQWIFFSQYKRLKAKAKAMGIEIIGDMPIFLSYDSSDVWKYPKLFDLDKNLDPKNVAGVGPDYFSPKGQMWGNPLYDWKKSKKGCYAFWKNRFKAAFEMYDVVRLDHFRGFADYWAIPAQSPDATTGKWKNGPGKAFFNEMRKAFPNEKFIGEDLGFLSERAVKLRDDIKIPNMAVLQFAFGGDASNSYLPHNLNRQEVCYTGTHDNDTTLSWYASLDEKARDQFRRYLSTSAKSPNWDMAHAAMTSVSKIAIIPMQDILSLGGEARFNTPGTSQGNWQWRMTAAQLSSAIQCNAPSLCSLCELSGRINK